MANFRFVLTSLLWIFWTFQNVQFCHGFRDQLPFVTVSQCAVNEFVFNPLQVLCVPCPANAVTEDGRRCVCKQGFVEAKRMNSWQLECVKCPTETPISSMNRLRCLKCETPEQDCLNCKEGFAKLETVTAVQCVSCSNQTLWGMSDALGCTPVEKQHQMVKDTDPDFPIYSEVSPLLSRAIPDAFKKCESGDDCNYFANLCVLTHYRVSVSHESPCGLYLKLIPGRGQRGPDGPWIYYLDEDTATILYKTNLPNKFTLNPHKNSSYLLLHGVHFDLQGRFISDSELSPRDLIPCAQTPTSLPFGANIEVSCRLTISELKQRKLMFTDVYLKNDNGKTMYPIPLLVRNLFKNGNQVNHPQTSVESQWQLSRRLFTIDHESVEGRVRYLKKVEIRVRLQSWWDGRIPGSSYPPLIILTYGRAKNIGRQSVDLSFSIRYEQTQSKTFQDISIAIGVLSTLVAMWACIRTWGWIRRNGSQSFGAIGIYKLLAFTSAGLADAFLLVLLCASLNWLIMFKAQGTIHLLLPTPDQESEIITYICVALALKTIEILDQIVMQQNWDIFLVDWELTEGATAWRSYLIAAEFLKLIAHRRINIGVLLVALLFLLKCCNLESLALSSPAASNIASDIVPYSSTCRLAIVSAVFISTAIVYYIYIRVLHERIISYNFMQRFVDLCSIANISVLTLTHCCYGYYIHGRSVLGRADVSLWEILEQLRKEENDLCAHRGLIPETDEQTFRINLLPQLKSQYNRLLEGTASPPEPTIERLATAHRAINRFLVAFLQHAVKDLDYIVRDSMAIETFLDVELSDIHDRCVFYKDPNGRTLESLLFSNHERSLLILDLLILVVVDWASQNLILSCVFVYLFDIILHAIRTAVIKRNLVKKSLIDSRFVTS